MKEFGFPFVCFLLIFVVYFTNACPKTDDGPINPPGGDGTYLKPPDLDQDQIDHNVLQRSVEQSIHKFQQHPSPRYIFKVMDNNADDIIDACEWMEAGMTTNVREYVKLLDRVDKNGDNVLSEAEFNDIHVRWRYGEMRNEDKQ